MAKTPEIPNKLYFRIGEVSDLVGVRPYVLRYWESEFPDIKPTKSKSGQRLYKRKDVESLVRIKQLLYEERFTIDGARKRLKELQRTEGAKVQEEQPVQIPKQLEVFSDTEQSEEEILAIDPPSAPFAKGELKTAAGGKIFVKLKKDLETLLDMVKK